MVWRTLYRKPCRTPVNLDRVWYNSECRESQVLPCERSKKFANPFYGAARRGRLAFAITATAYGVMAFREARPRDRSTHDAAAIAADDHPLMVWMRHHGETALMTELGLLALCTFGAIGTDDYWQRRARTRITSNRFRNVRSLCEWSNM